MSRAGLLAVLASSALIAPLASQGNSACGGYASGQARNICDAGFDGARVFLPVVGLLLTGGDPLLGSPGNLRGFAHTGMTLRVNGTRVAVPDLNFDGSSRTVQSTSSIEAPAPLVEGGLGLFRGGRHGEFALDLLGSAQLLPTTAVENVHLDRHATRIGSVGIGLGIGGRLTLVPEGKVAPAVAVSVTRRTAPRLGFGNVDGGDTFSFVGGMRALAFRATLGKQVGPLLLGAGAGWNRLASDAIISFRNPGTSAIEGPLPVHVAESRFLYFINGGLSARTFVFVAEAGIQEGKDPGLGTTFINNDPSARRFFGSVGLHFGY